MRTNDQSAGLRRLVRQCLLWTLPILLPGCASTEPDSPALPETPPAFSATGNAASPAQWWIAFEDEELNESVALALRDNPSIAAAAQRLRAARAVLRQSSADRWPNLNASARARTEDDPDEEETTETLTLGFEAAFEIDLWGRIADQTRAQALRTEATMADWHTAALSLTAEVVRTELRLREARARQNLLRRQLETNQQVLQLLQTRFANGRIRAADVLRQEQLMESTRDRLLNARARSATLRTLLLTLQGQVPTRGQASPVDSPASPNPVRALPTLPPLPDTGIPANLLQNRPDLRAAWFQVLAADRETAAAIANRFPRLTLTASLSTTEENGTTEIFDDWLQSFAAGLLLPLIDAGERRAEVERRRALREEALQNYRSAALTAFREVEDALVREQTQADRRQSLRRQLELAQQAYQQLRLQYRNGTTDYIEVLTALTDTQQLQRDLLEARRQLLEFRVALYRALAGHLPHLPETVSPPS